MNHSQLDPPDPAASGGWHLSKRIDLIQVIAFVSMFTGAAWFLSDHSTRLFTVETRVDKHTGRITTLENSGATAAAQLARMTALLESIDQRLARQERSTDERR